MKALAEKVAITQGRAFASDNNWSGMLYDGQEFYQSTKWFIHIIDRGAVEIRSVAA